MISKSARRVQNHLRAQTTQIQLFSTKNDENLTSSKSWNDYIFSTVEVGVKTAQQFQEFLFPPDLQKESTKEEIIQEIHRSNHLARYTTKFMTENIDYYTNIYAKSTEDQKFIDEMRTNQEKDIKEIESEMPYARTRPSILIPTAKVFGILSATASALLGTEKTNVLLYSIEKGIQDENDEQLRILNEQDIKDEELRKQIIQLRDRSYDQFAQNNKKIDVEQIKKENGLSYAIYQTGTWATTAAMRLSRKL
ncbi:ubiquinone biosynthesis protein coq7 homolog [Stylonychia lemnae]|uniref:Ubiquinone biosynthesis protein coq7 homolog n=1 Tax=Stylonychia lemnae TaxID=5949 RepID=A0A078B538_STYLE|nr:ubiquinone biosynthesis protein coq7 homolog [Stylonychia lemnae]|eukprot:CDW88653.1 ubiquinone biosynthesis protein coq7 homolog [Stylonychia lemnae]